MIRRLSELLRGGHYEHRYDWTKHHTCNLPSDGLFFTSNRGDIWRCKCGKRFECMGWSYFGHIKEWREIEDEKTNGDNQEDRTDSASEL